MSTVRIKNMVCSRCIAAVEKLLADCGYTHIQVELGKACFSETIQESEKKKLRLSLARLGFELLENSQSIMVEEIKKHVQAWVETKGERPKLSEYLQKQMLKEYSTLSKAFSETKGMTIEHYSILLRIEYAKEMLCHQRKNIEEIAYELGYSSPAHLSAQFKKETGITPSQFKRNKGDIKRCSLDDM